MLGAAAGVHLTVRLPTDCDVDDIVRKAANQRVRIDPLSWCYTEPACAPAGLILGYANLTESQIDTGVRAIAAAAGALGGKSALGLECLASLDPAQADAARGMVAAGAVEQQ